MASISSRFSDGKIGPVANKMDILIRFRRAAGGSWFMTTFPQNLLHETNLLRCSGRVKVRREKPERPYTYAKDLSEANLT